MANRGASSSSAPFTKSWKYHVFLSFRGFDTRSNFTSHLYSNLRLQGINTFMDDDELRRGEEISNALLTAIEGSKISVVVFSENYASSKWCLDELVKILDCKESNQQLVIPVFYKVNPSNVRNHRGSFGDALGNMERKYEDEMDKVKKWRAALSQEAALSGFPLDEHRSEAELIHNIVQHISREVIDRTYLYVTEYPVGMHHPVEDIIELLDLRENDVRMVGVWGTGGIGKTTIATAVYNSIAHEFEGCSFLANVRECSTWQGGGLAKLQRTLLYEILRDTNLEVANVHKGPTMIKQRLSCRKVLLVLDDVDDMEQLHKLVGACDWFGVGSRIIITTRDKQLLTAHQANLIHEVKILDDPEALELFCWHAFKRSGPSLDDYVKLAESAIRYAQGLPLALKVLGSYLCGGSIDKWQRALDGFQGTQIQEVLKISYNALDDRVKKVFLDIACFFKEKALISVEGSYIQMHDLLEKMGKDIIEQESPTEPGGRSRLWFHEDVEHVLMNDTGTNKITGIMLNFPKQDDEIFLDVDCFSKMKNLKILMNYNVCLSGDIGYLPNTLRVLHWYRCPLQSFPPNFRPKGLRLLNLPYSLIKQLGEGLKHMEKLTFLNFSGSEFLTEIPDLSSSPNLRYLNASGCTSLVEVHPSVGYLDKIETLNFDYCCELTKFPNKVGLKSLKLFLLYGCKKLESFPEIVDKMESSITLDLGRTAIKELPASIGQLIGLKKLSFFKYSIKELPTSIGQLIGLEELWLERNAIKELPASIGQLIGLEELWLERNAIKELPASIGQLIGLKKLSFFKYSIKELPTSIGQLIGLEELWLERNAIKELPASIGHLIGLKKLSFFKYSIKELPASIGQLIGLEELWLERNAIKELPASIGHLIGLKKLSFFKYSIKELPASIGQLIGLKKLGLIGTAIKELPSSVGNLTALELLRLDRSAIVELPSSIGNLAVLKELYLRGCENLENLPQSIYGLQNLDIINFSRCRKLVTLPNNLISEGLSSAESLPLEV
ncbi:PREDICTED: disease resistance protein TAO1-like [Prunus mume]|uniref:Disease resistance protein TAO1-like n=1 Tax=Prunus mume TaxID=102107 RepID=A0ABM1LUD9_PRUMU|nr:PREDICTED: disease resistance protein TAO1-like [Prunus mume]